MLPVGDGQDLLSLFMDFTSHGYPRLPKCVSYVYPPKVCIICVPPKSVYHMCTPQKCVSYVYPPKVCIICVPPKSVYPVPAVIHIYLHLRVGPFWPQMGPCAPPWQVLASPGTRDPALTGFTFSSYRGVLVPFGRLLGRQQNGARDEGGAENHASGPCPARPATAAVPAPERPSPPAIAPTPASRRLLPSQGAVMHIEGPMQYRFHQFWAPPLHIVAGILAEALVVRLKERRRREQDEKLERICVSGSSLASASSGASAPLL